MSRSIVIKSKGIINCLFISMFVLYISLTFTINYVSNKYKVDIFLLLIIPIIISFSTFCHEMAHFIVGRIFNFELRKIKIDFLEVLVINNENEFKINLFPKDTKQRYCHMIFDELDGLNIKLLMYMSAGIISNVLIIILGNVLILNKTILILFNSIFIINLLMNIIPYGNNDGKEIFLLLYNWNNEFYLNGKIIGSYLLSGNRLSEIDEKYLILDKEINDGSLITLALNIIRYNYYIYNKEYNMAQKYFKYIDDYDCKIDEINEGIKLQKLYIALMNNEIEEARTIYDEIKDCFNNELSIEKYRVQATYEYYANKNIDKAKSYINMGLNMKYKEDEQMINNYEDEKDLLKDLYSLLCKKY